MLKTEARQQRTLNKEHNIEDLLVILNLGGSGRMSGCQVGSGRKYGCPGASECSSGCLGGAGCSSRSLEGSGCSSGCLGFLVGCSFGCTSGCKYVFLVSIQNPNFKVEYICFLFQARISKFDICVFHAKHNFQC